MKAHEARNLSSKPQYEKLMEIIEEKVLNGRNHLILDDLAVYDEVANMLAKEGYDVEILCEPEIKVFVTRISWEFAQKERQGTVTKVNGSKIMTPDLILEKIFSPVLEK